MRRRTRSLVIAVACAVMSSAHAESDHGPRIVFPITLEAAAATPGNIKAGEVAFRQSFRSEKAVRLTEAHVVSYLPVDEKKDRQLKIPAGTLLVLARNRSGEMYCTGRPSDTGELAAMLLGRLGSSIQDAGYCIRDTNKDGIFDEDLVVDQKPYRTRIAYEILGLGQGAWKAAELKTEPVDPAQIPASEFHITYDHFSGGLFGKPRGVLHFAVCWPKSMVSNEAADWGDKACAHLGIDPRGEGSNIGAGDGARSVMQSQSFAFETVMDKAGAITFTATRAPSAGPGVLVVSGRMWQPANRQFQITIVDLYSIAVPPPPQI